jgi:hypothetical protein
VTPPDPIEQQQQQQQLQGQQQDQQAQQDQQQGDKQQGDKESDKNGEADDSGVDPSLGLLNAGPIQVKTDLEQPVTSGGLGVINEIPGG